MENDSAKPTIVCSLKNIVPTPVGAEILFKLNCKELENASSRSFLNLLKLIEANFRTKDESLDVEFVL
ncbi:hypothetical protein, partial [Mycoplasmopsis pullorum]|uniref:hypothetical protein n=1 Tax=Mycoplasmopsis pullorum TaxID=48003 RepID=UPI0011188385